MSLEVNDAQRPLLDLVATHSHAVLTTIKRDGRPQLSNVLYTWDPDTNTARISVTADRAKTRNAARDPRVSLHVSAPDFWSYAVVEGDAELSAVASDPTTRPLTSSSRYSAMQQVGNTMTGKTFVGRWCPSDGRYSGSARHTCTAWPSCREHSARNVVVAGRRPGGTMGCMRRRRWPAAAPPATGGVVVYGPVELATTRDLTLRLAEVVAHPAGLELRIELTATGRTADRARHETRPLDDPDDPSARWSYLAVHVRVDDVVGKPTRATCSPRRGWPRPRHPNITPSPDTGSAPTRVGRDHPDRGVAGNRAACPDRRHPAGPQPRPVTGRMYLSVR